MTEQSRALIETPGPVSTNDYKMLAHQAQMAIKSGLLPRGINTPEKALTIMLKGRELGISGQYALSNIVVIDGKPTCSAELLLALIYRDHGDNAIRFAETTREKCVIRYRRRDWNEPDTFSFDLEDAECAGLTSKDNWKKYPAAMLRARCISAVARLAFPDSIGGMYTPEELGAEVSVTEDGQVEIIEAPTTPTPRYTPEEIAATMAANPAAAKEAERIKQASKDTAEQSGRDAVRDASRDPGKPASQSQLATIAKYKRLLGQDEPIDEGMTVAEARELIVEITGEYARLHGTAGSANGASNEGPTAPAANGLQPLVEELATLKGLSPDEVHRDIEQRCRIESLYSAEGAEHDRAEKLLRGDIAKKQRDKERQAVRAGR